MTFRYDTWNIFTCNIMSILQIILFTWNVSFAWHFLFRVSFLHIHILREHLQHKQQQENNPPSGINKIFWLKKNQNIKQKQKIMGNGTQNTLLRIQLWWSNEPAQHILWVIYKTFACHGTYGPDFSWVKEQSCKHPNPFTHAHFWVSCMLPRRLTQHCLTLLLLTKTLGNDCLKVCVKCFFSPLLKHFLFYKTFNVFLFIIPWSNKFRWVMN